MKGKLPCLGASRGVPCISFSLQHPSLLTLPSHVAHLLPISIPGTWHPSSHALLPALQEAHKHPWAPHSRMLLPDVLQQAAPHISLKAPEQAKSWHWESKVRIYSSWSGCRGGNCELLLELESQVFCPPVTDFNFIFNTIKTSM